MFSMVYNINICSRHLSLYNNLNRAINTRLLNVNVLRCVGTRNRNSSNYSGPKDELMRALVIHKFGKPDVFKICNIVKPRGVDKGVILIRVEAAGINPVDTYIREGIYKVLPDLPAILGKEIAGTIERIADKETANKFNFKVGDRVFATLNENGGYAEYVETNVKNVFPLLGDLSFAQGASVYVTYYTAYRALVQRAHICKNDTLFIHGASGGVGTAALQIAKHLGIKKIGATAGTEEGMKMLKDCGADYVFNHRIKGHMQEAKLAMGNQGVDVILENFADIYLGDDCDVLAPGGRIAVVGCRGSVHITPRSLMITEGKIIGVNLGLFTPADFEECTEFILKGMQDGWLQPVIGREYTFEEAAKAHEDMIYKSSSHGKLVFKMSH